MSELQNVVSPHELIAYADDSYVVVREQNLQSLKSSLCDVMSKHFNWLSTIGMVCNHSKTELLIMGNKNVSLVVDGQEIISKEKIKLLGILVDNDLKWNSQVQRVVNSIRSISFGIRYLRRHISVGEMKTIIYSHVVSRMTYGSAAWCNSLNFRQKSMLRSAYFRVLRIVARDFRFELNRGALLRTCGVEHIDKIYYKRSSCFLFNIIYNLSPTDLVARLMERSYTNDRNLGRIQFFDFSKLRIGKMCFSNQAGVLSSTWRFDWFFLQPATFKSKLALQLAEEF